jgi:hypothetical protein
MRTNQILVLLLSLSMTAPGCAKFDLRKNIPWGAGEDGTFETPIKMIPCWTDTVLQTPNSPSMRGFGGRLMFYGKSTDAIKVEGSLVIYAFDEANRDPNNNVPDRKFVFTEEQFKQHHSKSERGHSYSFWIPWDQAGGERREISLIARFTPKKGGSVISEQTKHLLPGTTPLVGNTQVKTRVDSGQPPVTQAAVTYPIQGTPFGQTAGAPGSVTQADYQEPQQQAAGVDAGPRRRMETTTITLPQRFGTPGPFSDATVSQPGSANGQSYENNFRTSAAAGQQAAFGQAAFGQAALGQAALGQAGPAQGLVTTNVAPQGAATAVSGQPISNSPSGQPSQLEPRGPSARFAPLTPRAPIRPASRQPFDRDSSQLPPAEQQSAPPSSLHMEPAISDASLGSSRPGAWR